MAEGLQLCHDLGAPVLQVAGYYCYYEQMNDHAEQWYTDLLLDAVPMAARLGRHYQGQYADVPISRHHR